MASSDSFIQWRSQSTFRVVTKEDLAAVHDMVADCTAASSRRHLLAGLGREELAAVELEVLCQASWFVGARGSSFSEFAAAIVAAKGRVAYYNDETPV